MCKNKRYREEDEEPIDNTFPDDESAELFINDLSPDMLCLMWEDLNEDVEKFKSYDLRYHNVAIKNNRLSALVWCWIPDEGIDEQFTFDKVCARCGFIPRDVRKKVYEIMTEYERERFLKYQLELAKEIVDI